jgi:hypothetical protein
VAASDDPASVDRETSAPSASARLSGLPRPTASRNAPRPNQFEIESKWPLDSGFWPTALFSALAHGGSYSNANVIRCARVFGPLSHEYVMALGSYSESCNEEKDRASGAARRHAATESEGMVAAVFGVEEMLVPQHTDEAARMGKNFVCHSGRSSRSSAPPIVKANVIAAPHSSIFASPGIAAFFVFSTQQLAPSLAARSG